MKRWLILLCLLGLAGLSLTALADRSAATPSSSVSVQGTPVMPAAAPESSQSLVPPVSRPGIYAAFDYVGLDPHHYGLNGSLVVWNWSDIEVQEDVYDWSLVDEWLELQAGLGKASMIAISSYNGRGAPTGFGIIALPEYLRSNPNAVWTSYLDHKIPRYWRNEYLQPYQRFINELGNRYKDDPRVEAIAIGTGMYGEIAAWNYDTDAEAANNLGEVDVWIWIDTVKTITDYYIAAFSDEHGQLKKVLFNQTAPFTYNAGERRNIAEYSVLNNVGLSINGLYPEAWNAVVGNTEDDKRWTGQYDQLLRYDELGDDEGTGLPVPAAWETYDYMIGCDDGVSVYWAMLNGLDKHPQYMRLNVDLFAEQGEDGYGELPLGADKPTNISIFKWVQPYLAATIDNTPSVWVAMRDARSPWQTCWQAGYADTPSLEEYDTQQGNYDFWLYQFDNIAGGQTVVETNTCTTYSGIPLTKPACNPDLPPGREGWVIRRTNEPTNPTMWFDIDDGYIHGSTNAVTITVTYWDNYTDTWSLHYDAVGGDPRTATPLGSSNAWVQKAGSNTYEQAVFVITDARFADGLRDRADFYIDSNDDGNEWIHFVDLTNGEWTPIWEVPTPTPTLTPTPTSTPTVTPTPRPNTGRVYGLVFDDLNEDGVYDTGEPPVEQAVLELLLYDETVVMSHTTGSDGRYDFRDIEPGNYIIRETDPPGYRSTTFGQLPLNIVGGTDAAVNFGDRRLPTPTPTDTPTPTPTPTATPTVTPTPTEEPELLQVYLPLVVKGG